MKLTIFITILIFSIEIIMSSATTATSTEDKPIALLASPAKIPDLSRWVSTNRYFLKDGTFVTSSALALLLNANPFVTQLDVKVLDTPGVKNPTYFVDDIMVAAQVLQGKLDGVVYFHEPGTQQDSFTILERACAAANIPLVLNEATADTALRSLVKTRTAYLIFNPVAGQGQPETELSIIRSVLEPQMIVNVIYTQPDREAADQAKDLVNMIKSSVYDPENMPVIIASGGDGTVSAVAGATMNTGIPFAVIPRGTANAFSVALGIPTTLEASCRNILEGDIRVVDGAMVGSTPMILLAGIGFEAGMVEKASRELKDVLGPLAYILGGAQQIIDQQPFKCDMVVDGKEYKELDASAITVANVAPPTSVMAQGAGVVIPDDGLLDITVATAKSGFDGLANMAELFAAAIVQEPTESDNLLSLRAKNISLKCTTPQKVVIDGELLEMDSYTFSVLPGALSVVAPPKAVEASKEE